MKNETKNWIPSVNQFIEKAKSEFTIDIEILKPFINNFIDRLKSGELTIQNATKEDVLLLFTDKLKQILKCPLKTVINATGIILHTNLGRAPMSEKSFDLIKDNALKYTNIEYNLQTGKRAYRDEVLKDIFNFVVGSEDIVVVNNNAASLYLILKTYAVGKEVIISRGELIEIGGSFRLPDILTDTGAILKEIGTTNCTRISDYEKAITPNTALILKAHTSNYTITGYTESPKIEEIIALAKRKNIPFVYDAGSGLIRKPCLLKNVKDHILSELISMGIDIVCFSGDKLLGSSQAGIILGDKDILSPLKKNPLMRVLRADKLTIYNLFHHISMYKNEKELLEYNIVYSLLSQSDEMLKNKANLLSNILNNKKINNSINEVITRAGGGSLPDLDIKSYELQIKDINEELLYHKLLSLDKPIVTILKERKTIFKHSNY